MQGATSAAKDGRTRARARPLERTWPPDELARLYADFSTHVVELPLAGLDPLVAELLAELGRRLGAERTAVFELTDDRRGLRPWQAWAAPGVERLPTLELREGFAALAEDLPRGRGPRLVLPLRVGGTTLGAHVIDGPSQRPGLGRHPLEGVLAMALLRRHGEREHARQASLLDEVEQARTVLNHRLLRAHEEERARLAREIHDDLGQRLAALKLEIELLGRDAEATTITGLVPRLRELMGSADEVIMVARGLSHALHPVMLQQLGLAAAVEALCLRTTTLSGVEACFERGDLPEALAPEVALCLYRVAQEALGNVTRHSQACTATVSLGCMGEQLVLSICDDGVGMAPHAPAGAPRVGLGLLGMKERMRSIAGVLEVASTAGVGTCVMARVPLAHRRTPRGPSPR